MEQIAFLKKCVGMNEAIVLNGPYLWYLSTHSIVLHSMYVRIGDL